MKGRCGFEKKLQTTISSRDNYWKYLYSPIDSIQDNIVSYFVHVLAPGTLIFTKNYHFPFFFLLFLLLVLESPPPTPPAGGVGPNAAFSASALAILKKIKRRGIKL